MPLTRKGMRVRDFVGSCLGRLNKSGGHFCVILADWNLTINERGSDHVTRFVPF